MQNSLFVSCISNTCRSYFSRQQWKGVLAEPSSAHYTWIICHDLSTYRMLVLKDKLLCGIKQVFTRSLQDTFYLIKLCRSTSASANLNSGNLILPLVFCLGNCCYEGCQSLTGHPQWTSEAFQIQLPPSSGSESGWTARETSCGTGHRQLWLHPRKCHHGKEPK